MKTFPYSSPQLSFFERPGFTRASLFVIASLVILIVLVWILVKFVVKLNTTEKAEAFTYRLGDVIAFNGWQPYDQIDLGQVTEEMYPDSIAAAFNKEAKKLGFTGCHHGGAAKLCYPVLKRVADQECPRRLEAFKSRFGDLPEVVIHVRAANVINKDGKHESQATGRPVEFYEKLAKVLRRKNIKQATLVTSFKHHTNGNTEPSQRFVKTVRDALRKEGVENRLLITDDADMDFCVMLSAKTFVPSRSGLSEFAAEVALQNGNEVIGLWRRADKDSIDLGVYDPDSALRGTLEPKPSQQPR
jgi:hypothetical protein